MICISGSGKGAAGRAAGGISPQPGVRRMAYSSAYVRWHGHAHGVWMDMLMLCVGMGTLVLTATTALCYAYDLVGNTGYQKNNSTYAPYSAHDELGGRTSLDVLPSIRLGSGADHQIGSFPNAHSIDAVSYTHLTLPTSDLV